MNAAMIAQLVIALGPSAFALIDKLVAVWSKPTLTPDEVLAITAVAKTSYDAYIDAARKALNPTPTA